MRHEKAKSRAAAIADLVGEISGGGERGSGGSPGRPRGAVVAVAEVGGEEVEIEGGASSVDCDTEGVVRLVYDGRQR